MRKIFLHFVPCTLLMLWLLDASTHPVSSFTNKSVGVAGVEYFVSGSGDDRNNGLSANAPFRTIQKAANLVNPGDVVNVLDGEYTNACASCSVVDITRSGTAENWIIFRAVPGHKPVLRFNGWNGFQIKGGASYIEISGFELQGNRAAVTFEYCRAES